MEKNKKIKAEKLWFNWLNNKWNNFEAFRLLKKELDSRNKVKFVDFQKFKKSR